MGKQDAIDYIWGITNRDDLTEIFNVARKRSRQLEEQEVSTFKVGDTVEFKDKYGIVQRGTVTKVNQRTVNVDTEKAGAWRISPRFLTKVQSAE